MITLEPPRNAVLTADMWADWSLSRAGLSRFAKTAQAAAGLAGGVDVLLAGDRTLRRLNREFRGKDKATDVLSFPAAVEFGDGHAGDLAISLETARRQADAHGHSLRDEVRVLLLHGMLHLAGFDHETDGGEMAVREAELRVKLRLPGGLIERVEAPRARVAAANSGVLRFAQDDGEKLATATTKAKAGPDELRATRFERRGKAKALNAEGAKEERRGRGGKQRIVKGKRVAA